MTGGAPGMPRLSRCLLVSLLILLIFPAPRSAFRHPNRRARLRPHTAATVTAALAAWPLTLLLGRSPHVSIRACFGGKCEDPVQKTRLEAAQGSNTVQNINALDEGAPSYAPAQHQPSPAVVEGAAVARPQLELFIGVLSGSDAERRAAVREAWASKAQQPGKVVTKFVLAEHERTPQVDAELEQYHDILFEPHPTNYSSILFKTFHILEHAVQHYDAAFILKTDDDAFVNVPALLRELRMLCHSPGSCRGERLYVGSQLVGAEVVQQEGHRWDNPVFVNHTGLTQYPAYMAGGGYVVSADVAEVLVGTHRHHIPLKFTAAEDVSLAMWLLPLDLRRINHPGFLTRAERCCVEEIERVRYVRLAGEEPPPPALPLEDRLRLKSDIEQRICGEHPWVVLHKLDDPSWMRFVGQRVAACAAPQLAAAPALGTVGPDRLLV